MEKRPFSSFQKRPSAHSLRNMPLETYNFLIASGAVGLQILAASLMLVYVLRHRFSDLEGIARFVNAYGLWIGLLASLAAVALSLGHSMIFGLTPCALCYWQRIFIYPQVVLFALALWRKESSIAIYSIVLSVLGLGFALYHHALQMFPAFGLPCPATGSSCAQILFLEFGYVTYPMLAISFFAFLIVVMLFVRK